MSALQPDRTTKLGSAESQVTLEVLGPSRPRDPILVQLDASFAGREKGKETIAIRPTVTASVFRADGGLWVVALTSLDNEPPLVSWPPLGTIFEFCDLVGLARVPDAHAAYWRDSRPVFVAWSREGALQLAEKALEVNYPR